MADEQEVSNLESLLDVLTEVGQDKEEISIGAVLEAVGHRSFGPVLLIPGLVAFSPLSGIPGVPTLSGMMIVLIAGQLLLGRKNFWIPQFILRRSLKKAKFDKAIKKIRPVAKFVDRFLKPRLVFLTKGKAMYLIAGLCLILSIAAPALELVPFAISGVGAAVSAFSLALISHDGFLAIIALIFCITTGVIVGMTL